MHVVCMWIRCSSTSSTELFEFTGQSVDTPTLNSNKSIYLPNLSITFNELILFENGGLLKIKHFLNLTLCACI